MPIKDVAGQPRAIGALTAALARRTVHHAYLFAGPEGVGKELAAVGLAQALVCPTQPWVGCGACSSCQRVAHQNHPDVFWLMPEEEMVARGLAGRSDFAGNPSKDIRVEQTRALQERLVLRSLEAAHKVAILASAHQMNAQAQNAFLKTLEEPPKKTTIILLASAPEKLLPTIQSRCLRVQFGPLPVSVVEAKLREAGKLDESSAPIAAALTQGSLSHALELDVETLTARKELIEKFERLDFSKAGTLVEFAEEYGKTRELAAMAIKILQLWIRDLTVSPTGAVKPVNIDLANALATGSKQRSRRELLRYFDESQEALEAIEDRNGAPRLNLERMLSRMGGPS